jgi:hypothetical protein
VGQAQRNMLQFTMVFGQGGCYACGVQAVLSWLVRCGCALERLDNHWNCGVGSSGHGHTSQQPMHWNALHVLLQVPNSSLGLAEGVEHPDVWVRLHMHTEGSLELSNVWLRGVRELMDVVINTATFDNHHLVTEQARRLSNAAADDTDHLSSLVAR